MDWLPLGRDSEFQALLGEAEARCGKLEAIIHRQPELQPWFLREKARLLGFLGLDPLPCLRRGIELAAGRGQWEEIEKTRDFLLERPHPGPHHRQELTLLLADVARLGQAETPEALHALVVQTVLAAVPFQQILWLQLQSNWQVLACAPDESFPRFSRSLAQQCLDEQELLWGGPEQLQASRSLLLSEVRCLVAAPMGQRDVLFAWQSEIQPVLTADHVESLRFISRLAGLLADNLEKSRARGLELAEAERLHRRWQRIFQDISELGLAEIDDNGCLVSWNHRFSQLFPQAGVGSLVDSFLGRERDLLRLDYSGHPRWFQVTEWSVAGWTGRYLALLDVSERELELWLDHAEEITHGLASDLHDGPAQAAAGFQLVAPGSDMAGIAEDFRCSLMLLRSPWLEGKSGWLWLDEVMRTLVPSCEWRRRGQASGLLERVIVRTVLDLLQELRRQDLKRLRCSVAPSQTCIDWSCGRQAVGLPPGLMELVERRALVASCEVRWKRAGVKLEYLAAKSVAEATDIE